VVDPQVGLGDRVLAAESLGHLDDRCVAKKGVCLTGPGLVTGLLVCWEGCSHDLTQSFSDPLGAVVWMRLLL
jgi:hypothetical protein